ncbi:hypothetical protein NHH73_26385 [Oxalobacteraceae bacterium OTU3CINTB1]|nr:hypothetical protein NHH73_26385 [Oxalobacteraceae bacterium OTU3CINTB1]
MLKRRPGRMWYFFCVGLATTALRAAAEIPAGCSATLLEESRALKEISPYSVRGTYCDGTVGILNSGELLVVSYTVGDIQFRADQLRLDIFSRSNDKSPVHLIGIDKREGGSYRLDGVLGTTGLTVALTAAIHPKKIDEKALGLMGWRTVDNQRVYVPVATTRSGLDETAHLSLRTPAAIIQADYQICDATAKCAEQRTFARNQTAGTLISLLIPKKSGGGTYTVKLTILGPANRLFGQVFLIEPPL